MLARLPDRRSQLHLVSTAIACAVLTLLTSSTQARLIGNPVKARLASIQAVPFPTTTPTYTPTATPACGLVWRGVPSPNGGFYAALYGVSGVASNDIWAVGIYYNPNVTAQVQHWDGSAWTLVPGGTPAQPYSGLQDVTALAADDVWAVGHYSSAPGGNFVQPLLEHWDGITWTVVPSPQVGDNALLNGISATSPNDIWAVGGFSVGSGDGQTLIEHWDGITWTVVPSPNPGTNSNILNDVAAIAPNNVWAVGWQLNLSQGQYGTLIEHWDGTNWTVVPSPSPNPTSNGLNSIAAVAPDDIWATGGAYPPDGTLTMHWDGTTWSLVPNGLGQYGLVGLSAISTSDVWAVGSNPQGPMTAHWNGTNWTFVQSLSGRDLHSSFAVAGDDVWAVGDEGDQTLVIHYSNPCGTPVPSVTATPTRPTRTATATTQPSITSTPSNTPTRTPTSTRTNTSLPIQTPGGPSATPSASSTATPPCQPKWTVVPSPNQGVSDNYLWGVAVASTNDVWAVGQYSGMTLVEHWDGSAWSIVPSPNPSGNYKLFGIAVVSSNDVWAVGDYYSGNTGGTLVEHWDGSAWSIVPSPAYGVLYAVAAASTNDVWAVGQYGDGDTNGMTLIEHWDGSAWSIAPSPSPGMDYNLLLGVAVASTNDIWAVGYYNSLGAEQTLIEHWNGSAWSIVPSPNHWSGDRLNGVAVASSNDVWAVGFSGSATLVEHWNGSEWSIVPSANQGEYRALYGVAAASTNDIWAVGLSGSGALVETLVEHWNGSEWSIVPSPSPGSRDNQLHGVAVASNDVWAVGYDLGSVYQTLVERYNPCIGSPTPLPTHTPNPTPTSTVCPITFTDVAPGSTFYNFIRCLACRSIINGYPDGAFKPGNNVTRGQLSKIVSNSAGFLDPQTTQMFEDVPPGSTFFDYIGRLASRGYINGYPCSSVPSEPCVPPGNLPYFRTNNNATRGQISKIVSNAAGFSEPHTEQTFQDVPPGSTFYDFIERLASRDVMQGYPCDSIPTEPCVPPDNLPYFRPSNNATRGQSSKIVANTFFPNCITPQRR